MMKSFLVTLLLTPSAVSSFFLSIGPNNNNAGAAHSWPLVTQPQTTSTTVIAMIGGSGKAWDNNNYLDALGGNDDELGEAAQVYQEFSKTQSAFRKRQQQYAENMSKTESGRKALAQYQAMMEARNMDDDDGDDDDGGDVLQEIIGSGGGSRMGHMMQKAKQQQQRRAQAPMSASMKQFGFEQKFAVPLDDTDDKDFS